MTRSLARKCSILKGIVAKNRRQSRPDKRQKTALKVGAVGFEHGTKKPVKNNFATQSDAKSGALASDLAELIESWDRLPVVIRTSILAMVKAVRMNPSTGI
jgi:hypothetical protein